MQTFLPYPDYFKSAECLDYKRLGKQRVEAYQILVCLYKPNRWKNHPAVLQWKGYEQSLKIYYNTMILEWCSRGYRNTMKTATIDVGKLIHPHWLGNEKYHASHRSNLLRKDAKYYSQFGWKESNDLPYYWPSKEQ